MKNTREEQTVRDRKQWDMVKDKDRSEHRKERNSTIHYRPQIILWLFVRFSSYFSASFLWLVSLHSSKAWEFLDINKKLLSAVPTRVLLASRFWWKQRRGWHRERMLWRVRQWVTRNGTARAWLWRHNKHWNVSQHSGLNSTTHTHGSNKKKLRQLSARNEGRNNEQGYRCILPVCESTTKRERKQTNRV